MPSCCHILLIDGNPAEQNRTAQVLERELGPLRITPVDDELTLHRELTEGSIDLVITEHRLSWSDGLALLHQILERRPHLPVIMFTDSGTEEVCAQAMRAGLFDYVVKAPEQYRRLTAAARVALACSRSNEQEATAEGRLSTGNWSSSSRTQRQQEVLRQRLRDRTIEAERQAAQLRSLAAELMQATQRQRRHLAGILHDDLQQVLVAAKVQTSALRQTASAELAERAGRADELVEQAIRMCRQVNAEFAPPGRYGGSLVEALRCLAQHARDMLSLQVETIIEESAEPEAEEVREVVLGAVEELLRNVRRHAQVNRARVVMRAPTRFELQVMVEDKGVGFDPEILTDVVDRRSFGLFSIRESLQAIRGRLEVESSPGQGVRATLNVPWKRPRGASTPAGRPGGDASRAAGPASVRVLLADDHAVMRQSLARLLSSEPGIAVIGQAANGDHAVRLAQEFRPDVVVMDVTMPVMDGIEATRQITATLPGTAVIGLSMHERDDMQEAMLSAGAVQYLTKDGPPGPLIEAIRRVGGRPPAGWNPDA